jgi:TPR repeat protein
MSDFLTPNPSLLNGTFHRLQIPKLRALAEENNPEALRELGFRLRYGVGIAIDEERGWNMTIAAAKAGHPLALASCYYNGKGVAQDYAKAVELYKLSAELEHPGGHIGLGLCYDNGHGVVADMSKAVACYKLAAKQNMSMARFNLGICSEFGEGVERDMQEAVRWYELAAAQDNSMACYNLAVSLETDLFSDENLQRAVELYKRAASLNDMDAANALGNLYFSGRGVAANYFFAAYLIRRASFVTNEYPRFLAFHGSQLNSVQSMSDSV